MNNKNEYIKWNDKECGRTCFVLVEQDFCSSVDTYGPRHRLAIILLAIKRVSA